MIYLLVGIALCVCFNVYSFVFVTLFIDQCWIITVLNTFKHDYSRTVYNSTEKIQPDLFQYSFRVQSRLPPNTNNNTTHCRKKKQCTQIFMNKLTHKPPYNPKRNKSYFFIIHIFCIILFLRLIFTYVIT